LPRTSTIRTRQLPPCVAGVGVLVAYAFLVFGRKQPLAIALVLTADRVELYRLGRASSSWS
jgi:hypothetical protein